MQHPLIRGQYQRRKTLHEKSRVAFGKGEHQRIVQGDASPLRSTCVALM